MIALEPGLGIFDDMFADHDGSFMTGRTRERNHHANWISGSSTTCPRILTEFHSRLNNGNIPP